MKPCPNPFCNSTHIVDDIPAKDVYCAECLMGVTATATHTQYEIWDALPRLRVCPKCNPLPPKESKVIVVGIDPGPKESAWAAWDGERIVAYGSKLPWPEIYNRHNSSVAIEDVTAPGNMPVKKGGLIETAKQVGRLQNAAETLLYQVELIPRYEVKRRLCGSIAVSAGQLNRKVAQIDPAFGKVGKGKDSHIRAAAAVALAARGKR